MPFKQSHSRKTVFPQVQRSPKRSAVRITRRRQLNVETLETRRLLTTAVAPIAQFDNPDVEISGGVSELTRLDDSIAIETNATELVPGDAVTSWWVVFNNPEFCEGACTGADLRTPEVEGALFYADGEIVAEDGTATFTASLQEGDVSGVDPARMDFPGSAIGLTDASKAEVHFVMRTHGAAFAEGDPMLTEQLTTFGGGCNTECTNVQGVGFNPADSTSPNPIVAGDVDQDGVVDFEDFLILSANFGHEDATRGEGDLDGNGVVDFSDFLILSSNFEMQPVAAAHADALFDTVEDKWWDVDGERG